MYGKKMRFPNTLKKNIYIKLNPYDNQTNNIKRT